ncbi:lytic transglycosylase domain-containing protein [Limnobacter parvus]|uniref:Transglycosylase SLT domain-containing protein n=1 Tax=Limnobacter parvus TaxID=2939690 RepID=A0ABT1XGV9_9BURK|nr:transglycosylase SLT domain-containing protein [Limnobacter parvus]MCR2746116.1 transglycosylase SLT domain-containing protein [Limnobacter parvus]
MSSCVWSLPTGKSACKSKAQGADVATWVGSVPRLFQSVVLWAVFGLASLVTLPAHASQQYEPMADHVRLALRTALNAPAAPRPIFESVGHRIDWMSEMSRRLARRVPDFSERTELIKTIRYEAQRVGIDPQVIFAVIEVESNFRSNAVSHAGAIGLMQVMPFWTDVLSKGSKNELLEPRVNIRYGCLILRHYLDIEKGNLDRALGRYNGSLGRMTYPDLVYDRLERNWGYRYAEPRTAMNDVDGKKR